MATTQPSWKKQLILASVLFVAGSAAYWLEFSHRPKNEEKEEASKKLFNVKDQPVERMMVHDGARVFALKCVSAGEGLCKPGDNSRWELTEPAQAKGLRADDSNANALLSAVNNLNSTEIIDLKEESPEKRASLLKEYGLDPASRAAKDAKRIQVGATIAHLGLSHPIGEGIFAVTETDGKIDDSKVYLIPSYFKTNFEHDLTYWRDKKIVPFTGAEVASFELEGSKGKVSGVKKGGQWTLNGALPGDFENIDSLLSAAAFIQARDFLPDEKALAGTKKALTLKLQPEAPGEAITVALYEKAGTAPAKKGAPPATHGAKLYAKSSNLKGIVELERSVKDRLDKGPRDLRLQKLVTSVERYAIKSIEFSGGPLGAEPLTLAMSEAKWIFSKDKKDANREKVQAFLEKISGNRIQEFLAGAKIPPGQDKGIQVSLGDEKDPKKRRLVFWHSGAKKDKLYARDLGSKPGSEEAYLVDPAISQDLPWSRDHFAPPAPAAQPSAAASAAPAETKAL
jgi:hypothetical protein